MANMQPLTNDGRQLELFIGPFWRADYFDGTEYRPEPRGGIVGELLDDDTTGALFGRQADQPPKLVHGFGVRLVRDDEDEPWEVFQTLTGALDWALEEVDDLARIDRLLGELDGADHEVEAAAWREAIHV